MFKCHICEEAKRRLPRPVTTGRLDEPGAHVGIDGFEWIHPVNRIHCRAILIGDHASRHCVVSVGKETNIKQNLGNFTGADVVNILQKEWIRHYGKMVTLQFDPEGCFREEPHFKTWLSSSDLNTDLLPGEASWKLGTINKLIDTMKTMATKIAKRVPSETTAQEIFDMATIAHGDLSRRHGFLHCNL